MKRMLLVFSCLALLLAGCTVSTATTLEPESPAATEKPTQASVPAKMDLQSNKPRITNPQIAAEDLSALVGGNSAFALDLYHAVDELQGNLFFSPYSISLALSMTYAGARSQTEQQMASTLHFDLSQANLHPAFNALDQQLTTPIKTGSDEGDSFQLNIANALWGQQGFGFQPEFLDRLAENYGAGMRAVDFSDPEGARKVINNWVAEQTNEKIQDLIPTGVLDSLTRLVLSNAIYFKASWLTAFDEKATRPGNFTLLDGGTTEVDLMQLNESFGYAAGTGFQAVELPYVGEKYAMLVILPDEGNFAAFEQELTSDMLDEIVDGLNFRQIALYFPKFKIESSLGLADTLAAMGMPEAFDMQRADFSGMTGQAELYITDIVHKAFVDVNEAGTEAAAATAVVMGLKSMPMEPLELKIDRPFMFLIRDRQSGTILFLGRVLEP